MVQRIVNDIREALNNNLYFVALISALTLPDICGKAEYPNEKSRERYIKWYDKEIGQYEKSPFQNSKEEMPYLSGNVIYSLRCALLHEGNPNVENGYLCKVGELPINHFVLKVESKNEFDIYSDSSGISDFFGQHRRSYTMSVNRICGIICSSAEMYYEENKEKFSFDYDLLNWDEATKDLPQIDYHEAVKRIDVEK